MDTHKLKAGLGISEISFGAYSLLTLGSELNLLENYLPFPDGAVAGIDYKNIFGIALGFSAMAGGIKMLYESRKLDE